MSNKVARAGKFVVFVASRLEKHGKCRPSGGKWRQVARRFAGIFQIFPLPLYPKSPFLGTFRAAGCAKSASQLRKQPPPPYAPKRLAPLAIAEYVTYFCHTVWNSCRGSVKTRQGQQRGASAVLATLWGDYLIPIVSLAWGAGCWHSQTYRIKQGQSKRPSSGSGLVLCPCLC